MERDLPLLVSDDATISFSEASQLRRAINELAEALKDEGDDSVEKQLAAIPPEVRKALIEATQKLKKSNEGKPKKSKGTKRPRLSATREKVKNEVKHEVEDFEKSFRDWLNEAEKNIQYWNGIGAETKIQLFHGELTVQVIDGLDDCRGFEWAAQEIARGELNVGLVMNMYLYLKCVLWRRIHVWGNKNGHPLSLIATNPDVNVGQKSCTTLHNWSKLGALFEQYPALMLAPSAQNDFLKYWHRFMEEMSRDKLQRRKFTMIPPVFKSETANVLRLAFEAVEFEFTAQTAPDDSKAAAVSLLHAIQSPPTGMAKAGIEAEINADAADAALADEFSKATISEDENESEMGE